MDQQNKKYDKLFNIVAEPFERRIYLTTGIRLSINFNNTEVRDIKEGGEC